MSLRYFACLIFVAGVALPAIVFGYDDTTTHPALADQTVDLFDDYYPELKLNSQEKELIKRGSIDEDVAPRWMQHFYDPVYNRGLFGFEASPLWAEDTFSQAINDAAYTDKGSALADLSHSFFDSRTDYSWDRAVYDYVWGDKSRGLVALGHVLHLIADASVPDHTRNDPHPPVFDFGSPYELWTKQFTAEKLKGLSDTMYQSGFKPPEFSSLFQYFNSLANYSNNNFFSKDTIFDREYALPLVDYYIEAKLSNGDIVKFGMSDYGRNHLVRVPFDTLWRISAGIKNNISIPVLSDADNLILTDYWSHLSKQAILHGVGVMRLFFETAEKERQNKKLWAKNRSIMDDLSSTFPIIFGKPPEAVSNISQIPDSAFVLVVAPAIDRNPPVGQAGLTSISAGWRASIGLGGGVETNQQSLPNVYQNNQAGLPPVIASQSQNTPSIMVSTITAGFGGGMPAPQIDRSPTSINSEESPTSLKDTAPPAAPVVLSPKNGTIFTNTEIIFSGTAEPSAIISSDFTDATSTADSSGNWQIILDNFNQSTTTLKFFAEDQAGNKSSSTEISVFIDSKAPDINLNISACANSFSKNDCLVSNMSFTISWFSSASDLDHYEITCRKYNAPCNNFSIFPNATSTIFTGEDNSNYIFSAKAIDKNGNVSEEATKIISISSRPIAISEVAWAGTAANSNDEWVELFNKTSAPVSLDGWTLYAKNTFKPYIKLSGTIAGDSYYLLERKDDKAVSDIEADLIYGNGGAAWALNDNPADILVLSYASTTIEETPLCFGNRWCGGGTSAPRPSMERIDYEVSASDQNNWATSNGYAKNGKDAKGNNLQATPRARNSTDYLLSGNLAKDKTLKRNQLYIVAPRLYYDILDGATLNIEPGVVVKIGESGGMKIDGVLNSQGTDAEPIIFTSLYDDSIMGDTDNDGGAIKPAPGAWERIIFDSNSQISTIKNTRFSLGGRYYNNVPDDHRGTVVIMSATTSISNSVFEKSYGAGIIMSSSNSEIISNLFSENGVAGIHAYGGAPNISKNTFYKNAGGLYLESSLANVDKNIFNENISNAIYSLGMLGSFTENSGAGNGKDAIAIFGNITSANATATLVANPLLYSNPEGNYHDIYIVKNSGLEIEKGVLFKGGSESAIVADGTLHIDGENPDDILLTSSLRDEQGAWKGIRINPGGVIYGGGFTLQNAGGAPYSCGPACGGIKINGGSAELKNAKIEKNYFAGMFLDHATATLSNFEFKEQQSAALIANNSNVTLNGISFTNNGLAVSALASIINAIDIIFSGNTTTSSPPGLF